MSVYNHISTQYQELIQYVSSIDVDPGIYKAINAGVLIGIGILSFLSFYPGEPFDYSPEADSSSSSYTDKTASKNNKSASQEQKSKVKDEGDDEISINIVGIFNACFYGFILLGGLFIIERSYGISVKDLFRWYFPREAEVLAGLVAGLVELVRVEEKP